jgi:hypothetical protein
LRPTTMLDGSATGVPLRSLPSVMLRTRSC